MTNGTEPSLPLEIAEQLGVISGQKVGYARVSSKDQNLDRQIEQLKAEKVFTYYTDKANGGSRERPGLDEAMQYVRAGDRLVVTSMDRCARSLTDLYAIVDELVSKGVSVKFLKEGQVYSKDSTPIAKLMLGLLGSEAEFERSIIRERQAEGIARAKERGVYEGRPVRLPMSTLLRHVHGWTPVFRKQKSRGVLGWGGRRCIATWVPDSMQNFLDPCGLWSGPESRNFKT